MPRHLDGDARLGQVDREVRDLGDDEQVISPDRNAWNSRWRSRDGGLAGDDVGVQALGELVELVEVLADDQRGLAPVLGDDLARPRGS